MNSNDIKEINKIVIDDTIHIGEKDFKETKWQKFLYRIDDIFTDIMPQCFWDARRKIIDKKDEIRWAWQRLIKGYDNTFVWAACDVIPKYLIKIFTDLRDNHMGYPTSFEDIKNDEDWIKVLDRIIYCLKEMDENECSMKNEYENEFDYYLMNKQEIKDGIWKSNIPEELSNKYYAKENEIYQYRLKNKDEAFDLMKKYWYGFWD